MHISEAGAMNVVRASQCEFIVPSAMIARLSLDLCVQTLGHLQECDAYSIPWQVVGLRLARQQQALLRRGSSGTQTSS